MTYNNKSNLRSVEDVKAFFHHLVEERKVNFHPDDDFADYICYADKTPTFTKEEVAIYNRLMDEAFDVCKTIASARRDTRNRANDGSRRNGKIQ